VFICTPRYFPGLCGFLIGTVLAAMLFGLARYALADSYKPEAKSSQDLTVYLRQHRLPLVGAQVLKDAAGDQRVVLYGFVATDFGKNDAARKARAYLKSSDIEIDNRIEVRPEIARMRPQAAPAMAGAAGNESLDQVLNDIDRYGVSFPIAEQNPRP
jgi:hypothetical protein